MSTKKHYTLKDLEADYGQLTFGNALEAYRLSDNLSQKDFAKKLGITPQSLCDLEKGRRIPSFKRVIKIAKKLHEPIESWVSLVISDMMKKADLNLKIEIKKHAS